MYSKKARIIIKEIDVAIAAAFPDCFKKRVVISKIENKINSII